MTEGDSVVVDFEGMDHLGRLDKLERGWAVCTVAIDPLADYGSGTERLAPHQTVCVPISRVRPCQH